MNFPTNPFLIENNCIESEELVCNTDLAIIGYMSRPNLVENAIVGAINDLLEGFSPSYIMDIETKILIHT